MQFTFKALAVAAILPVASVASADLVYDESVDGELSADPDAPTFIDMSAGDNTVIFTTDGKGDDRDIFTFNVADGFQLVGVVLDVFDTNENDPANLAFIGFSAGSVLGTDPLAPDVTALLGYALVAEGDSGTDIFDTMGQGGGAQGYSGPLGAGDYTFWAQETSPSADDWQVTFVISQVPSPGALALLGVAGLARRRRRG